MKFRLEDLLRHNVKQMKPYASARDEYKTDGRKMIFLDANENPFGSELNRYPDPQQEFLKNQFAAQKAVGRDNILLGNGSDEVLDLLYRAFCTPRRDNVIMLPPTYGMYGVLADLNEVEKREIALTPDFEPDSPRILEHVDQNTKMIFLCSPNNPTGNSFSESAVLELLTHFHGLLVIDEAYIDFSRSEGWLPKLKEFPNLVVTQTLSKAYGLAGIRLGICYASQEIIQVLNKIKPPYNINALTQQKAYEKLLRTDEVEQEVEKIISQREFLQKELKKIRFVKQVFASDANFLLTRVDDADLRYQQLLSKGIVVRNRSRQPGCENSMRFTVGSLKENIQLLKVLQQLDEQKQKI